MAETETQTLKKDLDSLRNDFQTLTTDVREISEKQARNSANAARERSQDLADEAKKRSKELGAEIEARPYASIASAFGAGLLLGALLKR